VNLVCFELMLENFNSLCFGVVANRMQFQYCQIFHKLNTATEPPTATDDELIKGAKFLEEENRFGAFLLTHAQIV